MIVNAYAILDGFLGFLRLGFGLVAVYLAIAAWWSTRREQGSGSGVQEERGTLLAMTASSLFVLSLVSWPLFYLLLQSYVSAWDGVMCIYGVTQIGTGSSGPARFLPGLLRALEILKPALVFAGGAWLVLHVLDGRTASAPLAGRALLVLLAVGVLATADAATEIAYLVIPKKEEFVTGGCCTEAFDTAASASRFVPRGWVGDSDRPVLYLLYYALNGVTALALFAALRLGWTRQWLGLLFALMALSIGLNFVFLVEAAAPLLLHLPLHHCPYDLLPKVPESTVTMGLYVLGPLAVGWACVATWLGGHRETVPLVPPLVAKLLGVGLFGYLGSLAMMTLELVLAWAGQR